MMFVDLIHTTESCTAWLYVRNEYIHTWTPPRMQLRSYKNVLYSFIQRPMAPKQLDLYECFYDLRSTRLGATKQLSRIK